MPLRVRCRCGQELILKYSEWVYMFLVLVLLAVLANTTAVILLVVNLREPQDSLERPAGGTFGERAEAGPSERRVEPAEGTPGRVEPPDPPPAHGDEDRKGPASSGAPPRAAPEAPPKASSAREPPRHFVLQERPGDAVESLLEELELLAEEPPEETPTPSRPDSRARAVHEAPNLLRLLLLEEAAGHLDMVFACLLDPDPLIRLAAMERALSHPDFGSLALDSDRRREFAPLIRAARPYLADEEAGRRILRVFQLSPLPGAEAETLSADLVDPRRWADLQLRADGLMVGLGAGGGFQGLLEDVEARGADLLLAVDTTKSMERALESLKDTAVWLLPALEWGVRGSRVGLLLYKDEVEEVMPLSALPSRDILPGILALEARGGGDVPEGVYAALKAALELGRVRWRRGALKHIVIVGDQPPRYDEKRAFESLASACHGQAGFRVHALGINPPDGAPEVPYFAGFAAAGGGRHATCDGRTLGTEALACLLGGERQRLVNKLPEILRRLFARRR